METRLTTNDVEQRERCSYWRDMICDVFIQLDVRNAKADNFNGHLIKRNLPQVQFVSVSSEKQRVMRTGRQISKGSESYFIFSLQKTGNARISQDGRESVLRPNDFAMYDSTRPFELEFDSNFEQLVVQVPQVLFHQHISKPETVTAAGICGSSGIGQLVGDFLHSTAAQIDQLQENVADGVQETVLHLLSTAVGSKLPRHSVEQSALQSTLLHTVKRFILQSLGDSELCVNAIARAHQVSPRYIHKVFQHEGESVSRWIWNKRLEKCREELSLPALVNQSITQISLKWGFKDSAHFSRAFKKQFNLTPQEFRSRCVRNALQGSLGSDS